MKQIKKCIKKNKFYFHNLAEKLPKNETASTAGQGRRLVESEGTNKSLSSCCK